MYRRQWCTCVTCTHTHSLDLDLYVALYEMKMVLTLLLLWVTAVRGWLDTSVQSVPFSEISSPSTALYGRDSTVLRWYTFNNILKRLQLVMVITRKRSITLQKSTPVSMFLQMQFSTNCTANSTLPPSFCTSSSRWAKVQQKQALPLPTGQQQCGEISRHTI